MFILIFIYCNNFNILFIIFKIYIIVLNILQYNFIKKCYQKDLKHYLKLHSIYF